MNTEILTYVLSGALFLSSTLFGVLWSLLRNESREHALELQKKATNERLSEIELRLQKEVSQVDNNTKELIKEMKNAQIRDLDNLLHRLSDQLKNTESNVMSKVDLMIAAMSARRTDIQR